MTTPHGKASRDKLMAIVRERRGVHKSELMRLASKGWGNIGHHIDVLEEQGLVDLETHGRLRWVFDHDVPMVERRYVVAMRPTMARRIFEHLGIKQHATVRTLSEELAVSKKVIRLHLSSLQGVEAVQKLEGHPPAFVPGLKR